MEMLARSVPLVRARLLKCRIACGSSQAAIAKAIGISGPAMCKAEGEDPVDYATARLIADHYHVSVPYLTGDEDETSERVRVLTSIAELLDFMRGELQQLVLSYREIFIAVRKQTRSDDAARDRMSREMRARIDGKATSSQFVKSILLHFPALGDEFRDADKEAKKRFVQLEKDIHLAAADKFDELRLTKLMDRIGGVLEPLKKVRDRLHEVQESDEDVGESKRKKPSPK